MPSSFRSFRRAAPVVFAVLLVAPIGAQLALKPKSAIVRQSAPSHEESRARPSSVKPSPASVTSNFAADDTASVHRALRRTINQFLDEFRQTWKESEMEKHAPINLTTIRDWDVSSSGYVSDPYKIGDRHKNELTTDLRRYLSILCFVGTPTDGEIEAAKRRGYTGLKPIVRSRAGALNIAAHSPRKDQTEPPPTNTAGSGMSWATPRQIISRPNLGSICPSWQPPGEGTPPDEGEAIDLALSEDRRAHIHALRDTLLLRLDRAQEEHPNDEWITGQRVRFAFDQRDTAFTLATAKQCRGDQSWCLSLNAFAAGHAGQTMAAESLFRNAERSAWVATRRDSLCGNRETLMLLDHNDRDFISNESCDVQQHLIDRLWWLADPMWSVPGNERYVEHRSRQVHATLRAITDRDERYVWRKKGGGDAMRELIVRYGWPSYTFWAEPEFDNELNNYREHQLDLLQEIAPPYTAKEYSWDRSAFMPSGRALRNPLTITEEDYQLHAPNTDFDQWWPQEHMYYGHFVAGIVGGQEIAWRRDTNIVYQLAVDDPLRGLDTASTALSKGFLMGGDSPSTTRMLAQTSLGEGHTLRLLANISSKPLVMSAEILARTSREQSMRRRYGMQPPPTLREMKREDLALSDPLFLRLPNRTMPLPRSQTDVLRYMAGDLLFPNDEPLALYWESYGFAPGDTVSFNLKFTRNDNLNVAQRLFGAVGIGGDRDSVSIKWTEPDPRHATTIVAASKPVVGRTVAVDLSALDPGTYVVSIDMKRRDATHAVSERKFTIVKRPK